MKNKKMLIILVSSILGLLIGLTIKESNENESINKDKILIKEILNKRNSINELEKSKESLDKELDILESKYNDTDKVEGVDLLKRELSYLDEVGEGIIININPITEEVGNIANIVEHNKILIKILNYLKINKSNYIAINDQRINQYSAIVLAGNHINVNQVPIAPPYEIKCIGNTQELVMYMEDENNYISSITKNYPLNISYKESENIELKKMNIENKFKYAKGE